jgi:uncharacterized protein (TIGR00255 family)
MTGYGKASSMKEGRNVTIEMRSLNSKGLELNMKFPAAYRQYEFMWRNHINNALERGKIDVSILIEETQSDINNTLNVKLLKSYLTQLNEICEETQTSKNSVLDGALKLPGVVQNSQESNAEEVKNEIFELLNIALEEMKAFRLNEGIVLEQEVVGRVVLILSYLNAIEQEEPNRTLVIRESLQENLNTIQNNANIDSNRLEQEMIYYLERLDITEEIVRLKSHCQYFFDILKEDIGLKGRKLAFVSQEMGREINTIGSKANDKDLQKFVVQMKDELEKIKEQLNNVL